MKPKPLKPFRSAKTEVKRLLKTRKTRKTSHSQAYQLAFTDTEFLLHKDLRPIRLMLELLKPESIQREERIKSTIVVFGSARLPEPRVAKQRLLAARRALKAHPQNPDLVSQVKIAASIEAKSHYYLEAQKLGYLISTKCQKATQQDREFVIVTGGGPGIMEAANRGAYDAKAKSIGLNIVLPMEQGHNPYISPELCFQFHYFAIRKMHFLIRARALIAFPGGFGTLDELFETLTLLQTGKIKHKMPILLFGKDYWTKIIDFHQLAEEGMIAHEDLTLFQYVETAEQAWQIIADFYQLGRKTNKSAKKTK